MTHRNRIPPLASPVAAGTPGGEAAADAPSRAAAGGRFIPTAEGRDLAVETARLILGEMEMFTEEEIMEAAEVLFVNSPRHEEVSQGWAILKAARNL